MDELKDDPPDERQSELHRLRGFAKHLCSHIEVAIRLLNAAMSRDSISKKELLGVLDVLKKAPTLEKMKEIPLGRKQKTDDR